MEDYRNIPCDWCGKSMIYKERKSKTDKYTGKVYTICAECNIFPTREAMELWKNIEVFFRNMRYIPILTEIEDLGNNNWKIHYTWVFEDSPTARQGWIS